MNSADSQVVLKFNCLGVECFEWGPPGIEELDLGVAIRSTYT